MFTSCVGYQLQIFLSFTAIKPIFLLIRPFILNVLILRMEVTAALWLKLQKPFRMLLEMEEKLLTKVFWGENRTVVPSQSQICFLFNRRLQKLEGCPWQSCFNVLEVCFSRSRDRTGARALGKSVVINCAVISARVPSNHCSLHF